MKGLVVVESPAKAKTINKYLGENFKVMASIGHIKDLPEKELGIDIQNGFEPTYQLIPDSKKKNNKKIVAELKAAARESDAIYLAADPDREGEAICQHLSEELVKDKKKPVYRVLFNEITPSSITEAFKNPGQIDPNKVEAQQARRILDRLVGYQISPMLCRKVGGKLSAGRVQSVALRLIVEREQEIAEFIPVEYWTVTANLSASMTEPPSFDAKLFRISGKLVKTSEFESHKQSEIHIRDAETANKIVAEIKSAQPLVVQEISTKEKRRNPVPPFITSKLQQEASRRLRFPVKKTMEIAQQLYEGVELADGEVVGLITYMRTDSTRVSETAIAEVRDYIRKRYGAEYLPQSANVYVNKKNAQDAHEAIRPTSVHRTPESVAPYLSKDELALYKLIWQRFVASQMAAAIFDETVADIAAGEKYLLRATGLVMKFAGFTKVYEEGKDDREEADEERKLPKLEKGEQLTLNSIKAEQNFTKPPARYTEATLVKALEEKGIGRPSTYAQIISVIQMRKYVEKQQDGRFKPTELGILVNDVLVSNFDRLFDVNYTAQLEERLDEIEEGKLNWRSAISEFYKKFKVDLEAAERNITEAKTTGHPTEETCHKCGEKMVEKLGRFGKYLSCTNPACKATRDLDLVAATDQNGTQLCQECGQKMVLKRSKYGLFWACTSYPECKATKSFVAQSAQASRVSADETCPKCNGQLVIKTSKAGQFTACSNYPDCKYIKQESTGINCPQPGCGGEIVVKRSKRGRVFYGCNNYPNCTIVYWDKPVAQACPQCNHQFMLEKKKQLKCPADSCGLALPRQN
ncbi:MAG: type I DNA topoisomerase [Acidobacteriota bacterium]|nr:type I DNA topoisomerase [Blastocatellia bacterium]MDW8411828.1 type I DNA topoisomerase [Acidobacteriota bacterium]